MRKISEIVSITFRLSALSAHAAEHFRLTWTHDMVSITFRLSALSAL